MDVRACFVSPRCVSPEVLMPINKEGPLKKRGGLRHNWLVRRFVLGGGTIQYFDKQSFKGSVPTMFISEVRKVGCELFASLFAHLFKISNGTTIGARALSSLWV
jgi:hypothetical protein